MSSKASGLAHQVSRAVAWNTLIAPLKTVVELAANIIILNVLSLPYVGVLRLVSSAAASLGIWVDVGIDRALPRFIPELEQTRGRAAVGRFLLVIFAIKTALLLLFGLVFLRFSHQFMAYLLNRAQRLPEKFGAVRSLLLTELDMLAPWLIGSVLLLVILGSFYDGLMAYLISYFRQRAWNLIGLVGNIVQPTLAAGLVLLGRGIKGVLLAMVITPVISVALATWQVARNQWAARASVPDTSPTPPPAAHGDAGAPRLWRRFATYTGISNLLNLSDYIVSWYFAAFLLGDLAQVALFTTGTALVRQALGLLYTPLVGIQVPLFTRVRGGEGDLAEVYASVGRLLALILLPGGVGLALLAHELILVQYPHYAQATLVVYLLIPCLFLESFLSCAQITLQVYERYRLLLLPRALTLLLLPLIVWGALRFGLVGATLAVGGGRVLTAIVTALVAQRAFPLHYSWGFIARVALAAAGMGLMVAGIKHAAGLSEIGTDLTARLQAAGVLVAIAGAGALSFGVLLRLLGGLHPTDRRRILDSRLPLRRWISNLL